MANPQNDWWDTTAPKVEATPLPTLSTQQDWWETTKPLRDYTTLDPEPTDFGEDDDYWDSFTSWTKRRGDVARTLGRIPVRATEDIYNVLNEWFEFSTRARWENELFEEPQSAAEDITAEIGSWLGTFWVPGGAISKTITGVSKATGLSAKTTKLTGLITKTPKGKKAARLAGIASEGFLRGTVADYITTDIEDHEADQAIQKRLQATIEGGLLGAGINLTTFGVGRYTSMVWRKFKALKKVRQAAEGKGDARVALKELKKVIEDENKIKDDVLTELSPRDDIVDEVDPELDELFGDVKPKEDIAPEKKEEAFKKADAEAPKLKKEEPKSPELGIEEYINRASSLPDQIRRMVNLEKGVAERMNPKIIEMMDLLKQKDIESVRAILSTFETDVRRYRKLMEIRARAGRITGQSLRAFAADPLDFFSKSMVYKPEVLKRMNQIDDLLKLVGDVKDGKIKDEFIIDSLKKEIADVNGVIKGGTLSDALDATFGRSLNNAVENIWSKYQRSIAENVSKTLQKKVPQQKASLDIFSKRITTTLTDAVKSNKKAANRVSSVLDNVQDILANPEKYRESITKTIKEISDAKNIKAEDKNRALKVLSDLLTGKEGKRLFDVLPNRVKLVNKIINDELKSIGTSLNKAIKEGNERLLVDEVADRIAKKTDLGPIEKEVLLDHIRADLSNALAEMRDDVIRKLRSKELFQKFNLRANIKELDEMSDKSIKEIREYLSKKANEKNTPQDIALLQQEARKAKQVLKQKVKNADIEAENELAERLIRELSGFREFDQAASGTFELMLRAFEMVRMNMMLFSPRTWLVGVPTAAFNVVYQPIQQAVKAFIKAKTHPFEDISTVEAFKLAKAEVQGMSEYFSNFTTFWDLMKQTYKDKGQSAILPKSFRRHEEDLMEAGEAVVSATPIKVALKDKKKLTELIKQYGVKNERNETRLRKFLLEMLEGEPTTQIGKALDPLFSISFRAMGIMDEPFKAMGLMRSMRSFAMSEGIGKGLDAKALNDYVDKRMKEAFRESEGLPQWAGKEEFSEVEQLALSITYQADYADKYFSQTAKAFARWTRGGEDAHYNPLKILLRLQVPFIKTPTAIAQFGLDHFPLTSAVGFLYKFAAKQTPLHKQLKGLSDEIDKGLAMLASKEAKGDIIEETRKTLRDLHKEKEDLTLKLKEQEAEGLTNMILGVALTSSLAFAASTGVISGTGAYLTTEQRKRLIDAGWRPNSITIGGKRISYQRLEPWSTFMSSMADIVHYMGMTGVTFDELSDTDKTFVDALSASIVENMTNKYFITGLYEVLEVALDPQKTAMDIPRGWAMSLSPTMTRDLVAINEQFQREAVEWQARAKERMLGIHPGQYRRNLLGEKVERVWSMDGWWGIISPITWSDKKNDPIMNEIAGLRGKLGQTQTYRKSGMDTRKFYHKRTGQSLYDAWLDKMSNTVDFDGLTLRQNLNILINSPEYMNAPQVKVNVDDATKADLISNKVTSFKNDVWEQIEQDEDFRNNYLDTDGDSWTNQITNEGLQNKQLKVLTDFVGF